ncbi:MAG: xanthine dehydrogenase family protein subunit M [Chloroflexi bacterium]|nr:xanthine dehydrogenase family protein subunit M [Chloroflexota bacterium]
MIPSAFEYRRAGSVDEAIALKREAGSAARFIAGGHSLIPLMKLRLSEPSVLIDIGRVPGLSGVSEDGGRISIGALTTHADLESDPLLLAVAPIVAEAAGEIGDQQVRNRGTIGGSLAHADPAADLPAVVVALDAAIHIAGADGPRAVAASDFFRGLFEVDLGEDELITAVSFDRPSRAAYAKLRHPASHFAIVGVAAALTVEEGVCTGARVAVTGASTHARRLSAVEEALTGSRLDDDSIAQASAAASELGDVNADLAGSEEYRRAMTRAFTGRAIAAAASR